MRYCFLAEYSASRFFEGTNRIVFELSKALVGNGDSVTVLSPLWNRVTEEEKRIWLDSGIELRFFSAPFLHNPVSRTFFYFINGFFLSLSKKFDAFFGAYTIPPALATIWLGMFFGKKRYIGIWEEGACRSARDYWFFKPFYSRATAVQTLSQTIKKSFIENTGISTKKVHVIYGFADTHSFKPAPKSKPLLKELGIGEKDFVFLSVGRVSEVKGSQFAIRALAETSNSKLVFAGRIIGEDFFKKLATESGVAESVIFAGYVPSEKLPQYFNLCDCFLLPSLSEGFGLVIAESFCCGKPVIASDHGPLPEIVGDAGIIVPARDSSALAEAMKLVSSDKKKLKELSRKALSRSKEFEKQKILMQFREFLQK